MELLPSNIRRSDDLEAGKSETSDSDAGDRDARADKPHVHRITGEFADPQLTAEFGPMVFRSMYPLHVVGMGLLCVGAVIYTVAQRDFPEAAIIGALVVVLCALGLWARVAVHRWEDTKKAQSFGALAWTVIVGTSKFLALLGMALATEEYCSEVDTLAAVLASPLFAACFAVLNATHGMEFWHAASLLGVTLVGSIAETIACGFKPATILAISTLVVMSATTQFTQLIARGDFMKFHYIRESRDRLDFREQMSSHRERQASARLAVLRETGHSDPEQSSTSTASAPMQATRSAPSRVHFAPAATASDGVEPLQPDAVAAEPQTTGSGAAGPSGHPLQPPVMLKPRPVKAEAGPSTSADNGLPDLHPDEHLLRRPMFSLTIDEFRRQTRLMAQRDAEQLRQEQEDQASDAMSQDGVAPLPQGIPHEWSTTASSHASSTSPVTCD